MFGSKVKDPVCKKKIKRVDAVEALDARIGEKIEILKG